MTRPEFKQSFAIAQSNEFLPDSGELFWGFGLPDFKPVKCTLRHVAELIRWQARQLNGEWDMPAVQEIADLGRKRFEIVG